MNWHFYSLQQNIFAFWIGNTLLPFYWLNCVLQWLARGFDKPSNCCRVRLSILQALPFVVDEIEVDFYLFFSSFFFLNILNNKRNGHKHKIKHLWKQNKTGLGNVAAGQTWLGRVWRDGIWLCRPPDGAHWFVIIFESSQQRSQRAPDDRICQRLCRRSSRSRSHLRQPLLHR